MSTKIHFRDYNPKQMIYFSKIQISFNCVLFTLLKSRILKRYPEITAVKNITATIIATSFFLQMLASIDISGIAMPRLR